MLGRWDVWQWWGSRVAECVQVEYVGQVAYVGEAGCVDEVGCIGL
jgi:hypothetical protein